MSQTALDGTWQASCCTVSMAHPAPQSVRARQRFPLTLVIRRVPIRLHVREAEQATLSMCWQSLPRYLVNRGAKLPCGTATLCMLGCTACWASPRLTSNSTSRLPPIRLSPQPPALEESRKANWFSCRQAGRAMAGPKESWVPGAN